MYYTVPVSEYECLNMSLILCTIGDLLPAPTTSQWVSGHLTLAQALTKLSQEHEATKIMQDCIIEFTGTPEEARLGDS